MAMMKNGKVVRSGATPGAAGTMSNPGGVGRTVKPMPVSQSARTPGAAGTMSNPGGVGRTMTSRATSGVGAATASASRMPRDDS